MTSICQYDDGEVAWTEFECSSCGCHREYVAAEQAPLLMASDEGTDFPCPNCNVILPLSDITFAGEGQ